MNDIFVKINKGSVKSDEDSQKLMEFQIKYKATCNTHTQNSMWFNFEKNKDAFKFAKKVVKNFNYLSVTISQTK